MLNKRLSLRNAEHTVLGSLMSNLDFLNDPLVKLEIDDFDAINNKVIFSILEGLAQEGNEQADPEHVYLLMKSHPAADKVPDLIDSTFLKGIKDRSRLINTQTFRNDVERLNKVHALRSLQNKGIDIGIIFSEKGVESESLTQVVDKYTLEEIFNTFKLLVSEVEDNLSNPITKTYSEAGDGLEELFVELQETPRVGTLLEGEIFNSVTRGARFGKLFLNSAPSGGGKSRSMLGNAAALAMPYVDDDGHIVYKKHGYMPVLFIPTEQDIQEIQLMLLARVSGVNEESIQAGIKNLEPEELKRLKMGVQIIKLYSDNFHIEQIADPNLSIIKNKIIKHINKHKIKYIFYDYIFSSPALMQEFSKSNTREDVALMYMANTLKELATTYDIFVMTSTQLNSEWSKPSSPRNSNMLRGSKAISDKVDIGAITMRLTQEELLNVQDIVSELSCKVPNMVTDVYKNRAGSLTEVKIFRYFDYGTCRIEDLFLTTSYYDWIPNYRVYEEDIEISKLIIRKENRDESNGT